MLYHLENKRCGTADAEIILPGVGILKVTLSLCVDSGPVEYDRYEWQGSLNYCTLFLIF